MDIKRKKVFLLSFFAVGIFITIGNVKIAAAASKCDTGESCMAVTADSTSSTGFRNPTGLDCTFRGACKGGPSMACCKADTATTTAAFIKCYSDCVSTTPDGPTCQQKCAASDGSGLLNADGTPKTDPNAAAQAQTNSAATPSKVCGPTEFCNPLNFTTVEGFLGGILSAVQKIIVSLALVFIVIGAFLYITAGANPDNAENGKKAITAALVGLAIGIAAPSLLKELGNTIGWGGVNGSVVSGALTLSEIAIRVLNFLLGTMGIVALIMMVIGAILYLTSAGDEDQIDRGKKIFKYSLIGVLIAMASMVLVRQIAAFFATN